MSRLILLCILCCGLSTSWAQSWDFSLHKHQSGIPGPTLLVIGGIQGDEPGGFNAAALLATAYHIKTGEVWVVPNLNFESIIKRSRGVHGDMNRKFKDIRDNDPEYLLVEKIKRIILHEQVDMILNLHDGSGYYRPTYVDSLHGPHRWGQSLIIDQAELDGVRFGQLLQIANQVSQDSNRRLTDPEHIFHVKNTDTRLGDVEMEKTLTYYAIQNGKAAFGLEASKDFGTHYRAYYHLEMIEGFMRYLGIEYQRDFDLGVESVRRRIDDNIRLALYEKRMSFDMKNVRPRLNYVPMKKGVPIDYQASNPLVALVDTRKSYHVRYGNRSVTTLIPQFFEFDNTLQSISMVVDGQPIQVAPGDIVNVADWFRVDELVDYRVNIIGFTGGEQRSEHGVVVQRKDIIKRYSVDQQGEIYRIEIYRDGRFCGMVLVDFGASPVAISSNNESQALF